MHHSDDAKEVRRSSWKLQKLEEYSCSDELHSSFCFMVTERVEATRKKRGFDKLSHHFFAGATIQKKLTTYF